MRIALGLIVWGMIAASSFAQPCPEEIGYTFMGDVHTVAAEGDQAYIGLGDRFMVLDVSDPALPRPVGSLTLPHWINEIHILGPYTLVLANGYGFYTIDISDPTSPFVAARFPYSAGSGPRMLICSGTFAYVFLYGGIGVLDISDPLDIRQVGWTASHPEGPFGMAIQGTMLYVSEWLTYGNEFGLRVLDISDPTAPTTVVRLSCHPYRGGGAIRGSFLFVGGGVFDISDPANPQPAGSTTFDHAEISISENIACIATFYELIVMDISNPLAPMELGRLDDPYLMTYDPMTWIGGTLFLVGRDGGFHIVDTTVPSAIHEVGAYSEAAHFEDLGVAGPILYGVGGGMFRSFDVSDPAYPVQLSALKGVWGARLAILDSLVYTFSWHDLYTLDISDPAHPELISHYSSSTDIMDIAVVGDHAYLAVWDGLLILNIMNPTTPLAVGYYHTNDGSDAVRVQYPYAFLLTDDGIEILDISRPWSPTRVGFYGIDDRYDYWSNGMELEGTHLYIATWQGLLVVDVSDPPRPVLSSLFAHREGMVWYNHIKIAHPLAVVDGVYPQVLDISSPQHIRWLGEAHQQNINGGMAITSPHFYGATPSNGVYSFCLRACEMNHRRPLGHP